MRKLSSLVMIASMGLGACGQESAAERGLEGFLRRDQKMAECGDSFFKREFHDRNKEEIIDQFRHWGLEVNAQDLTEADKLNGLEFNGEGVLTAAAHRRARKRSDRQEELCWGKWESVDAFISWEERFVVSRSNGSWDIESALARVDGRIEFLPITCEEISRIPICN